MKDPYQVLGVANTADAEAIKQAYRRLARTLHPDLNPGDAKAEERFKEVTAAYDFLSDPQTRARYDRGEIDPTGAAKRSRWGRGAGAGAGRKGFSFGDDVDDILSELLRRKEKGRAQAHGHGRKPARGADIRHALTVTFAEAASGASKRVTLASGRTVEVKIPAGATEGQTLRLKGQGHPAPDGEPGDAYIELHVADSPWFTRRDLDVLLDLPVSVQEAMLGGKVTVPTVDGRVALSIPAGSNTGTVLRLKGKGATGPDGRRGDQLVTLKVVLPDGDGEFRKLVEKWGPRHGYDPRKGWGGA
ncbi:MAG: DnaJ C-terminal domain-containing protein [Actinomycetota bacterium]